MKTKFEEMIKIFFNLTSSSIPDKDPELPTSLQNNFVKTPQYGKSPNLNFDDLPFLKEKLKPTYKISKIFVGFKDKESINSLQFVLNDTVNSVFSPMRGSLENTLSTFELNDGEHITQIEIWSDTNVNSIRFITNKGRMSDIFGGNKGTYNMIMFKGRLVGIFGQSDSSLKSLGFIENIVHYKNLKNSCPPPWHYFDGKCYRVENNIKTFSTAKIACESLGGDLVNINTQTELNFVDNIISYDKEYYVKFFY